MSNYSNYFVSVKSQFPCDTGILSRWKDLISEDQSLVPTHLVTPLPFTRCASAPGASVAQATCAPASACSLFPLPHYLGSFLTLMLLPSDKVVIDVSFKFFPPPHIMEIINVHCRKLGRRKEN